MKPLAASKASGATSLPIPGETLLGARILKLPSEASGKLGAACQYQLVVPVYTTTFRSPAWQRLVPYEVVSVYTFSSLAEQTTPTSLLISDLVRLVWVILVCTT